MNLFNFNHQRRFREFHPQRGNILIETAVTLPFLLILLLGVVEVSRYVLLHQKLDRAATTVADLVSRSDGLGVGELDDYFVAAERILQPFTFEGDGVVIVSSLYREDADSDPVVQWQQQGAGTLADSSQFGAEGAGAVLPTGFFLNPSENTIAVEVIYDYDPWLFPDVIPTETIRHMSLFRPRIDDLVTLGP